MKQSKLQLDHLLVRVSEHRDHEAFGELHDQLAPRLKAYMMRQGASGELAEDLAQEVMIKLWNKAHLYSPDKGSASTWAYTIARNLRIDRIRREYIWQELPDGYEDTPDDARLQDENVSANERAGKVREALRALPQEQAQIIEMSFIDGLSHSEIATKLAVPLGTVKSRMRLGYAKLQQHLAELKPD